MIIIKISIRNDSTRELHVVYTGVTTCKAAKELAQDFQHTVQTCTVIPEFFTLLIFAHLIFVVIYYLQFQEAVNIHCSKNSFK